MTVKRDEPWDQVILRRYREKKGGRLGPLQVKVTPNFLVLLDAAARRMNVNRSTFIRRAVAVQAAVVLGIDVRRLLRESPSPKVWGDSGGPRTANDMDLGENIEVWCTHPGCDGSHL